jgi:hypothetical protein
MREASAGEPLHVTTQVLGFDDKRLHVFHELYRSGEDVLVATAEQMFLHVDAVEGHASPAAPTRVQAPEAGGFDWPSAAIGAAGAGLLIVVWLGGASVLSHRRTRIAR